MSDEDSILQEVILFADRAHGDQLRRYTGDRYIVHPICVMQECRRYTNDVAVLAAAILHDVLEDTPVTSELLGENLLKFMPANEATRTLDMVIELTDVYVKQKYPNWNRQKRKSREAERMSRISPDSQTIKYADIIDNSPEITEQDPEFAMRYLPECKALLKHMKAGHPDLYQKVLQTVNENFKQLKSKLKRHGRR